MANSVARHVLRRTVQWNSTLLSSNVASSSSMLVATRALSTAPRSKKFKNSPALDLSNEGRPIANDSLNDVANLAEDAKKLNEVQMQRHIPEVQYKAVQPQTPIDPFDLKKSRMAKLTIAQLSRRSGPRYSSPRMGPSAPIAAHTDPFLYYDIRPDHEHLNPVLLNDFVSDMGKIEGRNKTKLSRRSQRFVGKAIRRARAMGALPFLHRPVLTEFSRNGKGGVTSRMSVS